MNREKHYKRIEDHWDQMAQKGIDDVIIGRDLSIKMRYSEKITHSLSQQEKELLEYGVTELNGKILDCGCGNGNLLIHLLAKYPEIDYVGLDISHNLLSRAKSRIQNDCKAISLLQANLLNLPFKSEGFDYLICSGVIMYMKSHEDVINGIKEMRRVLKPGGVLIIDIIPNIVSFRQILSGSYTTVSFKLLNKIDDSTRFFYELVLPVSSFWLLNQVKKCGFLILGYRGFRRTFTSQIIGRDTIDFLLDLMYRFVNKTILSVIPQINLFRIRFCLLAQKIMQ